MIRDWPEASFFKLDHFYDAKHLGYKGPKFTWSPMPDQYTLAQFQKLEENGDAVKHTIARRVDEARAALDEQYDLLFAGR